MKISDKAAELVSRALREMEKDLESGDNFVRQTAVDQIILTLLHESRGADYAEPPDEWSNFYEKVEPEKIEPESEPNNF